MDGQDGEPDLFVRDMASGTTRWVSAAFPAGAAPFGVVVSPDGRWVTTRWEDGSLHLTSVATATTTRIATDAVASTGAFSRDGHLLAYAAAGQAYVRDLAGGDVTGLRTPPGGTAVTVAISADGRRAAYDWLPDGGGPGRIYVVDLTRAAGS